MLLTISTTHRPATDLGYLLHKNPNKFHDSELSFGKVHVFYPEATEEKCTVAIYLEIDPIGMVRGRRQKHSGFPLEQYVNDRPYVASSFLSVTIAQEFGSALRGKCRQNPELANVEMPLEATLHVVPCRDGEDLIVKLFEPLGYQVSVNRLILDDKFKEWGGSFYYELALKKTTCLSDLLNHLYVLIPVLDNQKHYFISESEIDKLLEKGKDWLAQHPEYDLITRRYLKYQPSLAREALARLAEDFPDEISNQSIDDSRGVVQEKELRLNEIRLSSTKNLLSELGARRIIDLGCGEGKLLKLLLEDKSFTQIVGYDVSIKALEIAARRINVERLPPMQKERIKFVHGSLLYRDRRLEGFDAAAVLEVIEHFDTVRLAAFERSLFEFARPKFVLLSTPNSEYNSLWPSLPAGGFRHSDHRFEWTRKEFHTWCHKIAQLYRFDFHIMPIGSEDSTKGAPTQMAVFTRL